MCRYDDIIISRSTSSSYFSPHCLQCYNRPVKCDGWNASCICLSHSGPRQNTPSISHEISTLFQHGLECIMPCYTRIIHSRLWRKVYILIHATARSAKHVLDIIMMSVCLSVRLSQPGTDSSIDEIETAGFYHMIDSLVSCEQISCRCVRRFPSNEGIKEGYLLRNRHFATISSSSVRMVADRHRLTA